MTKDMAEATVHRRRHRPPPHHRHLPRRLRRHLRPLPPATRLWKLSAACKWSYRPDASPSVSRTGDEPHWHVRRGTTPEAERVSARRERRARGQSQEAERTRACPVRKILDKGDHE